MRRTTSSAGIAIALVIGFAAAVGGAAWWWIARARPDAVEKRISAQIVERHAGASVASLDSGLLRVTLPSGLYIDVRPVIAIERCRSDRFDCSNAVDRVVGDVAHIEEMLAKPHLADLRAMIIGEASPGFRFGFLTEPLIGPLELRYALVSGAASTFVTSTVADSLGVDRAQLKQAAIANLAADGEPRAELLADSPGVYRVVSKDDAVAELISPLRMRRLAAIVGAARIYCAVPERGALFLARKDATTDLAARRALSTLLARARAGELLVYDTQAPEGRTLSIAEAGP